MTLYGLDISHWQTITPSLTGKAFCIVKATEGTTVDPLYAHHAANVRAAGLVLGAYCYGNPDTPIATQVALFLSTARDADLLALDIEAGNMTNADGGTFIRAVQAAGRKIGLYHSDYRYPAIGQDFDWVASWTTTPPIHDWDIWQYRGTPLDLDRFEGTRDQLLALGGNTTMTPLKITDRTPKIVALTVGDQLYNPDGSTLVKISVAQSQPSPYAVSIGTTIYRVLPMLTGGSDILALVKLAAVTLSDAPDRYAEAKAKAIAAVTAI